MLGASILSVNPSRDFFLLAAFVELSPLTFRRAQLGEVGHLDTQFSSFAFNRGHLVETRGFEPLTPCLQSRCSTN
jgi:hypothetical protein